MKNRFAFYFFLFNFLLSKNCYSAVASTFLQDLQKAQERSAAVAYAEEKANASSTRRWNRSLSWTPSVQLQLGKRKTILNGVGAEQPAYWAVNGSVNLFRSGADLYSFRSALAQERANELGKLSESLKLERQAANVIFKFLYLSDAQVAQKKQLSLKEVGLDIARSRYSQGKISLQELQKIEVDLSQQRNLWRNAQMEFAENRVELLAFFSDSLSTKVWPLEPGQTLALGEVTELSPETQSLLETVKAKEFAWKSSRLLHLPSLDLTYEYREQPLHGRRDKIFEAGIAITIPIWSRYGVAADAAEYYAEYLGAEKSVFIQKERNLAEQNFYRTKLQLSRENLLEARGNLARAEKLYADMLNSFRLGRISANDLFLEQNRLIESELNFSQSQMAFHATAMDVCALSGKSAAVCLR